MVNRTSSDANATPVPVAPVAKRKRRASCLGEQERRERKRAIDREAQRSLREKTKTHIAELERTIQILRDQDRNGATASLLSEIDTLRTENERLKDVIESVKSVIGGDVLSRNTAPPATNGGGSGNSPVASSADEAHRLVGQPSPRPRTTSFTCEAKPPQLTVDDLSNPFHVYDQKLNIAGPLDIDGMTIMGDMEAHPASIADLGSNLDMSINLAPVERPPKDDDVEELPWGDDPATASWAPMMAEMFGLNWRKPSNPVVLYIGDPEPPLVPSHSPITPCEISRKTNELLGKVFSYRSTAGAGSLAFHKGYHAEVELLYLGIKDGWSATYNEWMQSPTLSILKQVDELLFCELPKVQRLAAAYKNFKLLKYYLNATKEELAKVPAWLRPGISQSRTQHPIAIDFFAWPTLRDRLIEMQDTFLYRPDFSYDYRNYLRFEWPFSYEDAFYFDEASATHYPSPVFERYHGDLKNWSVAPQFFTRFPEMWGDIEGDRKRFCEEV
ncbi:hypothetical protein P153DRAFT_354555 [Dothidotthia symphoricarpi CBS 119687]|uniref:BZIP domain-containing protein n=1 Tax=Dothidotthia symphoricarpi CBS 119687 TaxID=1392245 RepID=A0A6A6AJZ0_9PLEO|nr:uncharacterized protein P153DRAFT_354555 [Dothidotthia symphoricarpi CBS 119687]KAF2131866.1 hypothetical protein P153DRAFT_354555 [Dothidotthia symphoricarpi CBS 119687]